MGWVPGLAPLPWQVSQFSLRVNSKDFSQPKAASSKEMRRSPLGSTDAAAASQAGIAAASLVAMDPSPARYYHTRLDKADILVPETIEKVIDIALQTVFDFDEAGI